MGNSISGADPTTGGAAADAYSARVTKLSIDAIRDDGASALALIDGAAQAAPPPPTDGKGTIVNRYA